MNNVDVLLFTDSSQELFCRGIAAYHLATLLRQNGYTVQTVDHFLLAGLETILKVIDKFVGDKTLIIGFSTTFMNLTFAHNEYSKLNKDAFRFSNYKIALNHVSSVPLYATGVPISDEEMSAIKELALSKNPNIKFVMGGSLAFFQMQSQIDAFILGYAENSLLRYLKYLQNKNPFFQFRKINENQITIDNDIDAAGYDFTNSFVEYTESDHIRENELMPLEIARGCIFKCKFCAFRLTGKKKDDYTKNPEVLYSELMNNYEKYKIVDYIFGDDTYNESVYKVEKYAKVFARLPFKINFMAYIRHDLIYRFPEMADLLKESGLRSALLGIETLNHEAGKSIGKGLHPDKTIELLYWLRDTKCWKNNIFVSSNFIIGLPRDTRETTIAWTEKLFDSDFPLDSFTFLPLAIYPNANRLGKSEFELNYEKYGYWFDVSKSNGWINEHWQFEDAVALASHLQQKAISSHRANGSGFRIAMLRNYGYSWEDAFTLMYSDTPNMFDRTLSISKKYFEKLLSTK